MRRSDPLDSSNLLIKLMKGGKQRVRGVEELELEERQDVLAYLMVYILS